MSPTLTSTQDATNSNGRLDGRLRSNISINTDTRSMTAQNASLNSPKASGNKFKSADMERYNCPALTMDGDSAQELLGSVTTFTPASGDHETGHALRTSARVIHKMRMDSIRPPTPPPEKKEAGGALPKTPQQARGHKNVWSNNERNIFFEALCEYGRDFESIATMVNNRMRRKAPTDTDYKTKESVLRLYNQIFQKLLKYLQFSDEISKVAKELYALINYGEMRKKLMFINDKCYLKLSDLVYKGAVTVREKGKNIKIKTPSCRALRKLNELEEWQEEIKLPPRIDVILRPANVAAWGKVQALAQNPRVKVNLPLQKRVAGLMQTLHHKWRHRNIRLNEVIMKLQPMPIPAHGSKARHKHDADFLAYLAHHNNRTLEQQSFCFTPPRETVIHRPMVNLSEFLSSYRICLNSYEERIGAAMRGEGLSAEKVARIKEMLKSNSKRQRHDSEKVQIITTADKKSPDSGMAHSSKRLKVEEVKPMEPDTATLSDRENFEKEKPKSDEGMLGVSALKLDDSSDVPAAGLVKCKPAPDSTDSESEVKLNVEDFLIFKQLTATSSSEENSTVVKVEDEPPPPTNEATPITSVNNNNNNNKTTICDSSNVISSSSVKPAKRKETGRNRKNKEFKPLISEECLQKIREGWTLANVGDLTVGDLYVMFGKELTLTLEYRWREDKPKAATPVVSPNPSAKVKSRKALERARLLSLRRPEDTVSTRLKQLLTIASLSEKTKRRPTCFCNHSCDNRMKGDTDLNPVLLSDGVFKQPAIPVRNLPPYYPDSYRLNPTYHNPSMRFRQTARWFNNRSPRKGLKIMPLIKMVPPRVNAQKQPVAATTTSAAAAGTETTSVSTSTETDSVSCFYEKAMEQAGNDQATAKDDVNKALEERIYRLKDRMTATAKNVVEDFDDASIKRLLYDSSSNLSYPAMYDLSYPSSPAMSPMRILREAPITDSQTSVDMPDMSLNSFLGHLEAASEGNIKTVSRNCSREMSSNLSVISETSVDFIAKFEDIAAELRASENIS